MTQRLSWAVLRRGKSLWSRNATPGATVYGEGLRRIDGKEHRRWDPTVEDRLGVAPFEGATTPPSRARPDRPLPRCGSRYDHLTSP